VCARHYAKVNVRESRCSTSACVHDIEAHEHPQIVGLALMVAGALYRLGVDFSLLARADCRPWGETVASTTANDFLGA